MSANILGFIQFDDNSPIDQAAFTNDPSWWSFEGDDRLWGCKDYGFIAAISGIRNESGIPPFIALRGCPNNPPAALKEYHDDPFVGYLTRSEILNCLTHHHLSQEALHHSIQIVLAAMQILADRYGDERVRFVFAIID